VAGASTVREEGDGLASSHDLDLEKIHEERGDGEGDEDGDGMVISVDE